MHEYAIVGAIVDRVAAEMKKAGATRVERVHVRIGELAGIDGGLLATAFELFRAGTVCHEAELVVDAVAARWACPRCGVALPPGVALRCPSCDVAAKLVAGGEITLQRLEMEVPDA